MRLACQGPQEAWLSLEALDLSMSIVGYFRPKNSFQLDQITFIQSFFKSTMNPPGAMFLDPRTMYWPGPGLTRLALEGLAR